MLNKKSVDDINVAGKKVLVRCDFNVPLKDGQITDENRLVAALPTIKKLISDGGKVILCSHLGKPKGEPKPELSLAPVAKRLSEMLNKEVVFAADDNVVGENAKAAIEKMENGDNPLEFPGLKFTQTADESKALNESPEPAIIISASGMCDVGRIKHHLKHNIWNPKSTILFVGYQAPGTLGYSIVNGAKKVTIFGEEFAVNARIEYIEGYSGHADQEWLMNFVYSFISRPKHIFLVHGEEESQEVLRDKILEETGIGVSIPEYGETYELCDELKIVNKIKIKRAKNLKQEIIDRLSKLQNEMKDMEDSVKSDVEDDNLRDEDMFRINEKIKDLEKQILNVIEG